jgi:hypothetical protein
MSTSSRAGRPAFRRWAAYGETGFAVARMSWRLGQLLMSRVSARQTAREADEGRSAGLSGDVVTLAAAEGAVPVRSQEARVPVEEPRAARRERPRAERVRSPARTSWSWIALLFLTGAIGVFGMVAGNALSRMGEPGAAPLFWAGLLLIIVPAAVRLLSGAPTRLERATLVAGIGLLLYLTKVLHDPFTFMYADEWLHLRNAEDILRAGGLFPDNSILPVSAFYPGLEAITAALATATGLSAFAAGTAVLGAARLVVMLGLFLVFERLSGSSRVAGIGALVYAANPNFLFFSVQFSYQSLALPLAVLALYALASRADESDPNRRLEWAVVCLVAIPAVVMTHHLTTYVLLVLFILVSLAAILGLGRRRETAWGLAAFTAGWALAWVSQVAPQTEEYVTSIFRSSFADVVDTVGGTSDAREAFVSSAGETAPLWERVVGLGSIALIVLALPLGLLRAWRLRRRSAILCVLAAGAAAYLVIQPVRLVPGAWETSYRGSDFLFVGIALMIAFAAVHLARRGRLTVPRAATAACCIAVITVGGVLVGWPPSVRLSQPYEARIGDRVVVPQGVALARWSLADLGPGHRFVAEAAPARVLLTHGRQLPHAVPEWPAELVLEAPALTPALADVIRAEGVSYAAVDRRAISADNMAGYFFAPAGRPRDAGEGLFSPDVVAALDVPTSDRLFDSGDVVAYDLRRVSP